jgi:hypothetical protein
MSTDTTALTVEINCADVKNLIASQEADDFVPVNRPTVPVSFHFARNQRQRRKYVARRRGGK